MVLRLLGLAAAVLTWLFLTCGSAAADEGRPPAPTGRDTVPGSSSPSRPALKLEATPHRVVERAKRAATPVRQTLDSVHEEVSRPTRPSPVTEPSVAVAPAPRPEHVPSPQDVDEAPPASAPRPQAPVEDESRGEAESTPGTHQESHHSAGNEDAARSARDSDAATGHVKERVDEVSATVLRVLRAEAVDEAPLRDVHRTVEQVRAQVNQHTRQLLEVTGQAVGGIVGGVVGDVLLVTGQLTEHHLAPTAAPAAVSDDDGPTTRGRVAAGEPGAEEQPALGSTRVEPQRLPRVDVAEGGGTALAWSSATSPTITTSTISDAHGDRRGTPSPPAPVGVSPSASAEPTGRALWARSGDVTTVQPSGCSVLDEGVGVLLPSSVSHAPGCTPD